MKKIRSVILALLLPMAMIAQENWEGGLFLGYSNYMGDLVEPVFTFAQSSPAFGLMLRNHLSDKMGLRFNLLYGKIKGDDAYYGFNTARNASFESPLVEVSFMGEYALFRFPQKKAGSTFQRGFTPYLFGGFGAAFGSPKVTNGETINYSNTYFSIPLGGGLRYDLNSRTHIGLELGGRFSFSDALDGISEQKGNPDLNDAYYMGGIVLGFRFGQTDTDDDGIPDDDDACPTQAGVYSLGGCPDADGDGIADRDDSCPDEPGDLRMNGCPDRDRDGVADNMDDCPDKAGLRRFSGCPDTDGDGIIDTEDNCPTVAGLSAMNGCPDADRDGITDAVDECPEEPGSAEHKGCPDIDNDGIRDADDECPGHPGLLRFKGCPDTDNDGISDKQDKCPSLPGLPENDGCPDISAEDKRILDLAMRAVQFESGSARLLPSSYRILDQIGEVITRYPGFSLRIDGYTDDVGNDFTNQQLSENRARACQDYLIEIGVSPSLLSYMGHGENSPIADNNTATGRRLNRRVTFTLLPSSN